MTTKHLVLVLAFIACSMAAPILIAIGAGGTLAGGAGFGFAIWATLLFTFLVFAFLEAGDRRPPTEKR